MMEGANQMLRTNSHEYLAKVAGFAEMKGEQHVQDLWSGLWTLHTLGRELAEEGTVMPAIPRGQIEIPQRWYDLVKGKTVVDLFKDFAPASFIFSSPWASGGFIYRGAQDGWILPDGRVIPEGHGVAIYSVSIGSTRLWDINT
jgi:hypothetical protein